MNATSGEVCDAHSLSDCHAVVFSSVGQVSGPALAEPHRAADGNAQPACSRMGPQSTGLMMLVHSAQHLGCGETSPPACGDHGLEGKAIEGGWMARGPVLTGSLHAIRTFGHW
jgi:hypothetical protein